MSKTFSEIIEEGKALGTHLKFKCPYCKKEIEIILNTMVTVPQKKK